MSSSTAGSQQPAPRSWRDSLKLLIGLVALGLVLYHTVFSSSASRLYAEWTNASDFVPASGSRLKSVECTNISLFIANDCTATAVTASGKTVEISDWRFGRAPSGRVLLMQRSSDPDVYSTNVSLDTLTQRLIFLVFMGSFGSYAFLVILGKLVRGR